MYLDCFPHLWNSFSHPNWAVDATTCINVINIVLSHFFGITLKITLTHTIPAHKCITPDVLSINVFPHCTLLYNVHVQWGKTFIERTSGVIRLCVGIVRVRVIFKVTPKECDDTVFNYAYSCIYSSIWARKWVPQVRKTIQAHKYLQ